MTRRRRRRVFRAFALAGLVLARPAVAEELPPAVRDMLREAYPKERNSVVNIVKRLYPNSVEEVDRLVGTIDEERKLRTTRADFIEGLRGDVSAGGYLSTGNTDEWGVSATLALKRQTRRWVHALDLLVDVKEEDGERTSERLLAGYTLRRNFTGSRWFLAGGLRYERDRFQGFARRFGQFLVPGYQIVDGDRVKWEVMAGPGFRQTRLVDAPDESQFGLFARTTFAWELTDTLRISEDLSAAVGAGNDTYVSTTSLTTDLYGAFALRLSFVAEVETHPPPGREESETFTRASIVYTFQP